MSMKKLLLFWFVCFYSVCFAQDIVSKTWKFNFQLDNRISQIKDKNITIFGLKAGVEYKSLTRFGIGTSFVLNPISIDYVNKKTRQTEQNSMEFWYVSVFSDWILFRNERWHCFVTEQIGVGQPNFIKTINDEVVSDVNVTIYINEISLQAQYKILPWIGAGAGFGYRNNLNKSQLLKSAIDAPVYIVKVILYPNMILQKKSKNS